MLTTTKEQLKAPSTNNNTTIKKVSLSSSTPQLQPLFITPRETISTQHHNNSQQFNSLKLFQLSAFLLHSYAYFYLFFLRQHSYDYGYGGQFKFFTVWTHTLNVLFYSLSVFNLLSDNVKAWLFKLSFVSSICVSIMFWGVQLLIDPDAFQLDPRNYPAWLNHAQHTAPSIIALMELSLVRYSYHSSVLTEILFVFGYSFSYFSFAYRAKCVSGSYPYPFMESFVTVQSFVWFAVMTCIIAVLVHVVGRVLSGIVHREMLNQIMADAQNSNDKSPLSEQTTMTTVGTKTVVTKTPILLSNNNNNGSIEEEEPLSKSPSSTKARGLLAAVRKRHRMILRTSNNNNNNNNNNNIRASPLSSTRNHHSPLFIASSSAFSQ